MDTKKLFESLSKILESMGMDSMYFQKQGYIFVPVKRNWCRIWFGDKWHVSVGCEETTFDEFKYAVLYLFATIQELDMM
mgnify:CR=1 FL=1